MQDTEGMAALELGYTCLLELVRTSITTHFRDMQFCYF